jgi:adenosine deaminase
MGDLQTFISSIPKTEIHLHIEACVSSDSYRKLMQKYDIPLNEETSAQIDFSQIESLKDMLEAFYFVQSFFREPTDFLHVVDDVVAYAKRNNIYYIEAFASPSMVLKQGMVSFDDMFSTLVDGFHSAHEKTGVDVRLIADVSRSFGAENAMNNLELLLAFMKKHPNDRILGIGLGGQEQGHPCADYREVFDRARRENLHVVAHAGEEVGPESVWEALDILNAERIGHGTSAIQDVSLMQTLKERAVPLEICPTSNVITKKYVQEYSDHPIRKFYDYGMPVTVNTDDPVLFSIELNKEYENMAVHLGFTQDEIITLIRSNLMSTFMPDEVKERKWSEITTNTPV